MWLPDGARHSGARGLFILRISTGSGGSLICSNSHIRSCSHRGVRSGAGALSGQCGVRIFALSSRKCRRIPPQTKTRPSRHVCEAISAMLSVPPWAPCLYLRRDRRSRIYGRCNGRLSSPSCGLRHRPGRRFTQTKTSEARSCPRIYSMPAGDTAVWHGMASHTSRNRTGCKSVFNLIHHLGEKREHRSIA